MSTRVNRTLLIVDGLGDLPIAELGGRTPLEAAATPNLDYIAARGEFGLVDPIGPGVIPHTDTGTSLLMGLDPGDVNLLRRGPIEAAGAGHPLSNGEVALRANFATCERNGAAVVITDRRAGRTADGMDRLAGDIAQMDLGDGVEARFYPTDQHRGVVVLKGDDLEPSVSDTDPGDASLPAPIVTSRPTRPAADFTAGKVNRFVREAHRRLDGHPVNEERRRAGLLPANCVITRGAGSKVALNNRYTLADLKVALVAGCNTVLGIGSQFGFELITRKSFSADIASDYDAKIRAAIKAGDEQDLVIVHIKAPDTCAHDRDPRGKKRVIERLDRALEPLRDWRGVFAMSADHTTDSNTGRHTVDPVPSMLAHLNGANRDSAAPLNFGESLCRAGSLGRQNSRDFIGRFLQTGVSAV